MVVDYSKCISRHTRFALTDKAGHLSAFLDAFPLHGFYSIDGLTSTQYRIKLNGWETEKDIKNILTQKRKYAALLNTNNFEVFQDGNEIVFEIPSDVKNTVYLGDLYEPDFSKRSGLPLLIGMDAMKNKIIYDLTKAPHMLIAGTTGSGKSICMHSIIDSLIMHDAETEIFMIDPKMTEYNVYDALSHFHLVKDVDLAIDLLDLICEKEMEERYKMFDKAGVRDIDEAIAKGMDVKHMVIMVDEFADLILTSHRKVENYVVRLAQKARACGIHLVIATQRPTKDVVTGLIKSNIPTRICMKVNSALDSRIILDRRGGETITTKGEMLLLRNGDFDPIKVQGCYMSEVERKNIVIQTALSNPEYLDKRFKIT